MLTGYKTYITAALMIALGGAELVVPGLSIPGFSADPGTLIMGGFGLIFAKINQAPTK